MGFRRSDSLPFLCQQCGECCSHLGLVHKIGEILGDYRFLVYNQYSGEKTVVTVDPDKTRIFNDTSIFTELPEACPFFRHERGERKACCTVHSTRPDICRDYGCWRLLILDFRGRRAGRISGKSTLCSEDTFLTRLWEYCIKDLDMRDDVNWEEEMIRTLSRAGYSVRK
ncbi:MAG: YkgJ family cysteine cluster protein [Methanoregula sp.]|nr:YkgJ family cysteine cluster protein [Methanoregula sp.]